MTDFSFMTFSSIIYYMNVIHYTVHRVSAMFIDECIFVYSEITSVGTPMLFLNKSSGFQKKPKKTQKTRC